MWIYAIPSNFQYLKREGICRTRLYRIMHHHQQLGRLIVLILYLHHSSARYGSTTRVIFYNTTPDVRNVEIITDSERSTVQVNLMRGLQNCTSWRNILEVTIMGQRYCADKCCQDKSFQVNVNNEDLNITIIRRASGAFITMYALCQDGLVRVGLGSFMVRLKTVETTNLMPREEYFLSCLQRASSTDVSSGTDSTTEESSRILSSKYTISADGFSDGTTVSSDPTTEESSRILSSKEKEYYRLLENFIITGSILSFMVLSLMIGCCILKYRSSTRRKRQVPHRNSRHVPASSHVADQTQQRVIIKVGDITCEDADGIVFGANAQAALSSGVGKAINDKLDEASRNFIKTNGMPPTGIMVARHSSRQLPAKQLLLVNIAALSTDDKEWVSFILKILNKCEEQKLKSVSLPALGTGGLKIACEKMAFRMLNAIRDFYSGSRNTCLKDIRIVVYESNMLTHFTKVVNDMKAKDNNPLYDNWTISYQVGHRKIIVPPSAEEYKEVVKSFRKTIGSRQVTQIVEIIKVDQPLLREQFRLEQRKIADLLKLPILQVTKAEVWHGTSAGNADRICHQNFNRSFAGENVGTVYGKGVYFSTSSNYSYAYSPPDADEIRHMIRAQIVVGDYAKGRASMKYPPPKTYHTPYISTVDNILNPSIFVIYSDAAALPEYVVRFKGK